MHLTTRTDFDVHYTGHWFGEILAEDALLTTEIWAHLETEVLQNSDTLLVDILQTHIFAEIFAEVFAELY